MASSISSNRRGKLSLKRKRTADCSTTNATASTSHASVSRPTGVEAEEGAVDENGHGRPGKPPTKVDSFSTRVLVAESTAQNSSLPSLLRVRDAAAEPSQDRKVQTVSDVVIDGSSRLDISKMTKLQELPPWYGVKEDKTSREEPTSSELEIKIGNLSMKWSPLPPYCRQCLFRNRQKRAQDLPRCPSPSSRSGDLKKNVDSESFSPSVQNNAKKLVSVPPCIVKEKENPLGEVAQGFTTPSSLSKRMQNGQDCSFSKSVKTGPAEPLAVPTKRIPTKNLSSEPTCSDLDQQPSTSSKTLSNSATSKSTNERKALIGFPGGQKGDHQTKTPEHVDSFGTSSLLNSLKRDSRTKSSPLKKAKGDRMQKLPVKEDYVEQETLRKESGLPASTSKSEPPLPFQHNPGIRPEGTGPGFKEKVDARSLSDRQPKKSFGECHKTVASSNAPVIFSESPLKLVLRNVGLNSARPEHSNIVHSNTASRPSSTFSPRGRSSTTSLTRDQTKNQDLNPPSPEIIIIDSDEEEECVIQPVSTSSCLSSNLKRKLSGTVCDADKKTAKKLKMAVSATGASGSPAAKLTSDAQFHSGKEHTRYTPHNIKLSQVKGTSQSKLNVMSGRTIGSDVLRLPSGHHQAASTTEFEASALKGSSGLPVRPRSVTSVCKESTSVPVKHVTPPTRHPSSKKTNWNLSGHAKPLFKQQQSGRVEALPVKTSQGATKKQGNISKGRLPNSQTQNKKSPIKENTSISSRTLTSFFKKQDASTSSKLSIGMPSTPDALLGQWPESRQTKNQSTFRSTSNWGFEGLEKPSATPTAKNQRASSSGFQSARTIQTHHDHTFPREDSRTSLSKETGLHPMRYHQTGSTKDTHPNWNNRPEQGIYINYPKQDSRSNHSAKTFHKSTNQDTDSNQNTHRGTTGESATVIQSCPLCLQSFHQSWTTLQRDEHIAKCLAESGDDVNW